MNRWLAMWVAKRKLRRAMVDLKYFEEEVERCSHNVDIAKYSVNYWARRLYEAKYPVVRIKIPGDVNRC